ncbi:MAG: hypothetical protein EXR79_04720 [Myxococcales bacterium]|nr:hypothetical protein [Myxococcales bacterium]
MGWAGGIGRGAWGIWAALGLLAAVVALPTLAWPFGRDQAIFHYIGRQWGQGQLPYLDTFDVKPPGIYLLFRLTAALGGDAMWPIRVADVGGVLATGALLPWAWPGRADQRPRALDMAGCAVLALCVHFAVFDFWDSAQAETWLVGLATAAAAVARWQPRRLGSFGAGLLLGAAALFKPTALVMVPWVAANGVTAAAADRSVRGRAGQVGAGVIGMLTLPTLAVAWFGAHGAGAALAELWEYSLVYAGVAFGDADARTGTLWLLGRHGPVWPLLLVGALVAEGLPSRAQRPWGERARAAAGAAGLLALAWLGVAAQHKFFTYHWGAVAPFAVGLVWSGTGRAIAAWQWWRVRPPSRDLAHATLAGLLSAGLWVGAPDWTWSPGVCAVDLARYEWPWWCTGELDAASWYGQFRNLSRYDFSDHWRLGTAIRARARPGDQLHVRGFELAVYAVAGLATPARFVSELPLDEPALATPRREVWLADHERRLWQRAPRFFVTFRDRDWDLMALRARGYREIARSGWMVALER